MDEDWGYNGAFRLSRGFFAPDLWANGDLISQFILSKDWTRVGNVLRVHKYSNNFSSLCFSLPSKRFQMN